MRPRSQDPKDQRFHFRLTQTERDALENQAADRGLKPAQYLRSILTEREREEGPKRKRKLPWER